MIVHWARKVEDLELKKEGWRGIEANNAKEFASYQCDAEMASAVERQHERGSLKYVLEKWGDIGTPTRLLVHRQGIPYITCTGQVL